MTKNKYTKTEIKFYEILTQIYSIHASLITTVLYNFRKLAEEDNKVMDKFIEDLSKMGNTLAEAKIPNKFLILNSLEDKKKV